YTDRVERRSTDTLLDAVRAAPPTPVASLKPQVAPELIAICEKAMPRAPEARYADMQEMSADLRSCLEVSVVRAYRAGALAELGWWVRRNRVPALLGTLALLSALAGLSVALAVTRTKNRDLDSARADVQSSFDDLTRLSALQRIRALAGRATGLLPPAPE